MKKIHTLMIMVTSTINLNVKLQFATHLLLRLLLHMPRFTCKCFSFVWNRTTTRNTNNTLALPQTFSLSAPLPQWPQ
ncbi:hypothetical protein S245_051484, partial [Arachis hypogaea]